MTSTTVGPKVNVGPLPELSPLEIGALVVGTHNLLQQAIDLPQPHMITVSDLQSISLQFPPQESSQHGIACWALRFGGLLTARPERTKNGPETWVRLEFDFCGVAVDAYAHIPA